MIAYKGTNKLKCINITYEVGKTYEIIGDVIWCQSGFHLCRKLDDVMLYYNYTHKNVDIMEIEVDENDIVKEKWKKIVARKIKILRIIPKKEYHEHLKHKVFFDDNENLIKDVNEKGYFKIYQYDENNNKIQMKDSSGNVTTWEYDDKKDWVTEVVVTDLMGKSCKYIIEGKDNKNGKSINNYGKYKYNEKEQNLIDEYKKGNHLNTIAKDKMVPANITSFEFEYDEKGNVIEMRSDSCKYKVIIST